MSNELLKAIEETLDQQIRPVLLAHGGGVDIIKLDGDKLHIKLIGGCQGCAGARATLRQGIERVVTDKHKEIKELVDATDHAAGDNPFFKE